MIDSRDSLGRFAIGSNGHNMPHSEYTKELCAIATKKRWEDGKFSNRPLPREETKIKISNTLRRGSFKKCVNCNKEFYYSPSHKNKKFCSQVCNGASKKGPKNHNWNGGTSRAVKTGYYSQQYINWRSQVFIRDGYTCQQCLAKCVALNAHHIKPFAKFPELRFDLANGITLCVPCHRKIHTRRK